ncbi:hypothetical protein LEP1GSC034_1298 [Leptospira interrogans str. 2003000735]|uniref:Uncharacterized protein n=1 Tax=Leptospira interrogans str. 2002000626 TaxID=996803 RepID=A0A829DDV6_LEPIR|nr:hypothetical protein LEP1GSC027_0229 [Leptospira interrogans str. 2002000624]EKQ37144.1 hypothetical protein LEP1GSC025_0212 [Leptospira interrogans str. 2002000621]EKQ48719.1 hypothetical protein LEP1GSC026_2774 [Leptospira interrogans str. 2002000623]EMJ52818.1 hypothetical protein LEP1GSC013_4047 [Leptospira interrogans serovar Valbuzzi str. Duyster]EMJ72869.1 hypothetical protein LEP1GSC034_1298 [Leptospira interrogans str. 2003000735]EMJ72881.1 hypothetical protein LEP1GSC033_2744 [Lep
MSLLLEFFRHSPLFNAKKNKILNQNGIRLLSSLTFFKGIQKINV